MDRPVIQVETLGEAPWFSLYSADAIDATAMGNLVWHLATCLQGRGTAFANQPWFEGALDSYLQVCIEQGVLYRVQGVWRWRELSWVTRAKRWFT